MPHADFSPVWDQLPPEVRDALVRNPGRTLDPDSVDALARAGARDVHALWLEDRPGRPKQWLTSWSFRLFVEGIRDAQPSRTTRQPRWTVAGAAAERS